MTPEQRIELKRWVRASRLDPAGTMVNKKFKGWIADAFEWIDALPLNELRAIYREIEEELYGPQQR